MDAEDGIDKRSSLKIQVDWEAGCPILGLQRWIKSNAVGDLAAMQQARQAIPNSLHLWGSIKINPGLCPEPLSPCFSGLHRQQGWTTMCDPLLGKTTLLR